MTKTEWAELTESMSQEDLQRLRNQLLECARAIGLNGPVAVTPSYSLAGLIASRIGSTRGVVIAEAQGAQG